MQYFRTHNSIQPLFIGGHASAGNGVNTPSGAKTVGRWLKDRKEKKKEETRAHNAQLHAAISVAAVASAISSIAAATAASSSTSGKNEQSTKTDMAVASAATLVAAQCVEAAEAMGAERYHLASVVSSAVNVRSHDDIVTLTAAAATGKDFSLAPTQDLNLIFVLILLSLQFQPLSQNYGLGNLSRVYSS